MIPYQFEMLFPDHTVKKKISILHLKFHKHKWRKKVSSWIFSIPIYMCFVQCRYLSVLRKNKITSGRLKLPVKKDIKRFLEKPFVFICFARNSLYEDRYARKEKASHLNSFYIHTFCIMYYVLYPDSYRCLVKQATA